MAPAELSVVIPTFDRPAMLREALESAFACFPLLNSDSCFVVDDGFNPETQPTAEAFPVTYFRTSGRLGPSGARNAGLLRVETPFVAFLDDDDMFRPGSCTPQIERLAQDPELGMAFGRADLVNADLAPWDLSIPLGNVRQRPGSDFFLWNDVQIASVVFRTAALKAIGGFDQRLRYCEDSHAYALVAQRFGAAFVDAPHTVFRQRSNDAEDGEMRWRSYLDRKASHTLLRGAGVKPTVVARLRWGRKYRGTVAFHLCFAGSLAEKRGEKRTAAKYLRQGLIASPTHALLQGRTFWRTGLRLGLAALRP